MDIGQYDVSIWSGIPSEIGLFLQLKYLSVRGDISDIPSSIGSLTNLETLILNSRGREVSVPDTFWNLQKLKHVVISWGFRLAFENLEIFPELCELQSCSRASLRRGESIEQLVRKFPNIRKLSCLLDWKKSNEIYSEDSNEIETLKLDSLCQLESLCLWFLQLPTRRLEFNFPDNLRKLRLSDVSLRQSSVSRIGKLSNLEVLKFDRVAFEEDTWEMVEGEFLTLRFLILTMSKIVRWTAASDDQFPCLEKLVLEKCRYLTEITSCFESMGTLEMVEVSQCCEYVNSFFKGIQDEQTELGNSLPKIQITN